MKNCKFHKRIMIGIATISFILLGQHITGFEFAQKPQPEPTPQVQMLAVGDIMLDRAVASHMKKYGNDSILEKLAQTSQSETYHPYKHDPSNHNKFFDGYDLITGNLEGAVADYRRQTSKSIAFNFTDEAVNWLMDYGFNLVSLANNHSYDMGRTGFAETKKTLEEIGLQYYGEQYSVDNDALFIKNVNGITLAFIGLNDTNSRIDREDILPLLSKAEELAHHTIVNIHWGQEYKLLSNSHQQDLAHYMIDHGADIIIGHHPHVVQEMEIYNNRPIYYSLGNFIFDQYFSEDTQQGLGLSISFFPTQFTIAPHAFKSVKSENELMNRTDSEELFSRVYDSVDELKYFKLDEKMPFEITYDMMVTE